MRVFAFRDERECVVALIPAFLHPWENRQQLTLLGSGISDYLDPAIDPNCADQVVNDLGKYLRSNANWDVINWQDLSSDTPLTALGSKDRLQVESQPDTPCSEIFIDEDFATFWSTRPNGLKRNVRRYREKAEQIAPLEFAVTSSYNEECFAALIRLHSERWREQGEPGMIAANRSSRFLREVAQVFASRQMLRFCTLRFQGQISAVILAFAYRDVLYGYLSAFDPAMAALGFGRTLLYGALQYAFENKYTSWNFLRGTEPYKADWGAREIPKSRLLIRPY